MLIQRRSKVIALTVEPSAGDKLPGSPSTTNTTTPAPAHPTDEAEQLQDLSTHDARVLQPLNNLPEQTPACMTGSQSSTEAICRAAVVQADAACCPQTISSHNKQKAALGEICSMGGPAFDRVYNNPCAEEAAPDLSGLRDADPQGQPSAAVTANPAILAAIERLAEDIRPHVRQENDMDIDEAELGLHPEQEKAQQQSPQSSSAKGVIHLSTSPDAKHSQQEATAASTMPVGSESPRSVDRKAASKIVEEETCTHKEHRGAPRPWYQTPFDCPELPGSAYAVAKEHPTRHTVPPSRPGGVGRDASAQQRRHASSGNRLPPFRRKRKSPDLGEAAWAVSPTAQPGSGACNAEKARNVVSRSAAASEFRDYSGRIPAHDQKQASMAQHEPHLQLSPDATQCSEPAPEVPTPKEAHRAEHAPSEQLQGALAAVPCPSRGPPPQRPVWKSRGGREATGNGVAQTLHLLDMQQCLLRGVNVRANGGANDTTRLPRILERAEVAQARPFPTAPQAPSADDPGKVLFNLTKSFFIKCAEIGGKMHL